MDKHYIICLCGMSGVGKTSIEQVLWKLGYHKVISYTTRNCKDHEIDTVDYNFVEQSQFFNLVNNNEMLEYTQRYGNFYGIAKNSIDLDSNDYVCTVDPNGYYKLKEYFGDRVIGIYIYINDYLRLSRLSLREKDVEKALGRYFADNEVFKEFEKNILYKVTNIDIQQTATTIHSLIMKSIKANNVQNKI